MTTLLFAFPGMEALAQRLAAGLDATIGKLEWHHFPDGESLMTLQGECKKCDVIFVCTFHDPDHLALPLLFAVRTARELGARQIGLIAPYLAYMRQDTRFHSGEAISSLHFAAFLSSTVDWLVTVDPHLHRHADLSALFTIPNRHVSAMPLIADWIRAEVQNPVLIGPDRESTQWVQEVAEHIGAPMVVLDKHRHGDRDVEVSVPNPSILEGRIPVLVDDIISSGHTLIETLQHLRTLHLPPAMCIAVHGIFADQSDQAILQAGAARLITSNTIPHATNVIDVTPVLLPAIRDLLASMQTESR